MSKKVRNPNVLISKHPIQSIALNEPVLCTTLEDGFRISKPAFACPPEGGSADRLIEH